MMLLHKEDVVVSLRQLPLRIREVKAFLPHTALGQERCARPALAPAPAPALPCLLAMSFGWEGCLSLDSMSLSPSWEFFAGDLFDGSPLASKRTEANGSSQKIPNISSHAQAHSHGGTRSSDVRNSCPRSCWSSQSCTTTISPKCGTEGFTFNSGSQEAR